MALAKDERPNGEIEASEDLRGSKSNSTAPIGSTVEKQLSETLWQLITGEVELHELTPALLGWWSLAYDAGRQSLRNRIDRLEWERDLWYYCANNKGKRPSDYWNHQTDALWAKAVAS